MIYEAKGEGCDFFYRKWVFVRVANGDLLSGSTFRSPEQLLEKIMKLI